MIRDTEWAHGLDREERRARRADLAGLDRAGYLQEANRLFFHPHGLSLELLVGELVLLDLRDLAPERPFIWGRALDAEKAFRLRLRARVLAHARKVHWNFEVQGPGTHETFATLDLDLGSDVRMHLPVQASMEGERIALRPDFHGAHAWRAGEPIPREAWELFYKAWSSSVREGHDQALIAALDRALSDPQDRERSGRNPGDLDGT